MLTYGLDLIASKRADPGDDMLSVVVHATLDDSSPDDSHDAEPPSLTDGELYAFFSLLFSAGSETTRNAMAGGLIALAERPHDLRRPPGGPDAAAGRDRGDPALDRTVADEATDRHA